MQTCTQCGTRAPQLPVRIEVVRESGPIGLASGTGVSSNFTRGFSFCTADHLYTWAREGRYMICNRQPTAFEAGMQPYLPSRHMGGRVGLCDGHHTGGHEWKEAWPG
ncbi:MAG: hypothetical protein ABJB65_05895 [Chloroflexota bacterium]